jgi:3-dehydroquinate synthetase
VAEARLAERLGIAERGLVDRIAGVLDRIGLPTTYGNATAVQLRTAMAVDKKKAGTALRFALPVHIGEVRHGVEVDETLLAEVLAGVGNRKH